MYRSKDSFTSDVVAYNVALSNLYKAKRALTCRNLPTEDIDFLIADTTEIRNGLREIRRKERLAAIQD